MEFEVAPARYVLLTPNLLAGLGEDDGRPRLPPDYPGEMQLKHACGEPVGWAWQSVRARFGARL